MKNKFDVSFNLMAIICLALFISLAAPAFGQTGSAQDSATSQKADRRAQDTNGPGREMGQGGKDIGIGAAKGSMDLGKGVVGGAGNLVTGHPVDAGASLGKGAVGFGKNVGVGAGKGTYKIGKGLGGLFKKLVR